PRVPENEVNQCSQYLVEVERKHIVSGCNGVIRLLQNGQALAFFILDSFNPQIFAKLIIQMARKRNPSVLVFTLPSFPVECHGRSGSLLAVTKPKESEQSKAVQKLISWMRKVSLKAGYITEQAANTTATKCKKPLQKKKKPNVDASVKEKQATADKIEDKKRVAKESENFISFSDHTESSLVASSNEYQQPNEPQTIRFKPFKSTYIPLTVNRIRGNPDRVEHKKKRKTQ
uniref:Uncharacterized protein n=1 Tax=Anopheles epiroticus TaxID=199890 RepID=A0A182PQM4_9DIPT